jgi:GDP/UDP-N,N'-diacetylbacillosamine 2-epimerase (hydrolysing)
VTQARSICFVTGTRAEFGLMRSTLRAIEAHPRLRLQLVVTGMHLDRAHGRSLDLIRSDGWAVDAVVPWRAGRTPADNAAATGLATAALAKAFARLRPDVVLVVGDRVEPFAAAAAAHLSHIPVAHVHGGDRALGQVDDALRHAVTKLVHVHFPATRGSAKRIIRLGEDPWRVHPVGSPGVDAIEAEAAAPDAVSRSFPGLTTGRFALLVLHPSTPSVADERRNAELVLDSVIKVGFEQVVVVYPNNDPGAAGILSAWRAAKPPARVVFRRDLSRPLFLGLMRDAAALVGNSSSGIIEAASFGTPVVDVGPRQSGRERSGNVVHVGFDARPLGSALARIWNGGRPRRSRAANVYGGDGAGRRIAKTLATIPLDARLVRKLIAY